MNPFKTIFEQGREQLEEQQFPQFQQTVKELLDSSNPIGQKYGQLLQGIQLHETSSEEEAIAFFDDFVAKYPDFELGYFYRFEIYNQLERYEDAKKDAEQLVALDSNNIDYLNCLMASEEYARNFEKVVDICNRVLAVAPDQVDYIFSRASATFNLKDFEGALADYQLYLKAQDLDEFDRQLTYIDMGRIYLIKEEYDNAKQSFEQAKSAGLEVSQVASSLGLILAKTGEKENGIAQINEILEMDPHCAYSYINRARLLIEKGDFVAATKDIAAAQTNDLFKEFVLELNVLTAEINKSAN